MEKGEWLIVLFLFSVLYLFTSSVDAYHLTGYSSHENNQTNQTNQTHLECLNQACVLVNGTGQDMCKTNQECLNQTDYVRAVRANRTVEVNLTHLECLNQACVLVNGTGNNTCTTSQDCLNQTNLTYLTCINQACVRVPGNLTDQCLSNLECQNQTNMSDNGEGAAAGLPLAPLPSPKEKSTTLAGLLWDLVRSITGLFGL